MSDEPKLEGEDVDRPLEDIKNTEAPPVEEPKFDEVEYAATKGHINDKEAFEADHPGKTWYSADEFNRRERDLARVYAAERAAKAAEALSRAAIESANKERQKRKELELGRLDAAKKEAIEVGDLQQYEQISKQEQQVASENVTVSLDPGLMVTEAEKVELRTLAFLPENKTWTDTAANPENKEMLEVSDQYYTFSKRKYPERTVQEHFSFAKGKMQELFPHRFQAKPSPSTVAGGQRATLGSPAASQAYKSLDDYTKKCCDDFVNSKLGTRDEYIQMYKRSQR